MRIGRCAVRVGGVGAVGTHGDYRKRGLMLRTGRASIEAMRRLGYDMTLLFGIKDFYHRFGYVRAWPETGFYVATGDLPKAGGLRLRKLALVHRDDLDRLYNRQNAGLTGTAIRPTFSRRSGLWGEEGFLWTDRRGRAKGYVVVMPERGPAPKLFVLDSAGDSDEVLAAAGILARRKAVQEVRFGNVHLLGELARRLKVGQARLELNYRRNGGPMIRAVNLRTCLGRIAPELSRRLRASALAGWRGRLLVADPRDAVVLDVGRGRVTLAPEAAAPRTPVARHCVRGGQEIVQLLIGADEPLETVRIGAMKLSGDAPALVEALFPRQYPMLAGADRC
jgi:hypothetical protein